MKAKKIAIGHRELYVEDVPEDEARQVLSLFLKHIFNSGARPIFEEYVDILRSIKARYFMFRNYLIVEYDTFVPFYDILYDIEFRVFRIVREVKRGKA